MNRSHNYFYGKHGTNLVTADGVFAIDTQWALLHGYAETLIRPYDDSKSFYQIDTFHSMHCIVRQSSIHVQRSESMLTQHRLRNKLTSDLSLQQWWWNDQHTLHCLDYIREQLMCNADLTLQGTDDLLHFNKTSGHVCRSWESIMRWSKTHH